MKMRVWRIRLAGEAGRLLVMRRHRVDAMKRSGRMRRGDDCRCHALTAAEIAPRKTRVAGRRRGPAEGRDEIEPGWRQHRLEAVDIGHIGDIAGQFAAAGGRLHRVFRLALAWRGLRFSITRMRPSLPVLISSSGLTGRDASLGLLRATAYPAGQTGWSWPSGTEGRAQWGGVSDSCTVGFRWRSVPAGAWLSIDQRANSSAVNSGATSFSSASGTSQRPTSQPPVCAREMRTSQLPPSRARRASATIAPNAIRYPVR